MPTITKKKLVDRVASSVKAPRTVIKQSIQRFLEEMMDSLCAGNRLEFRDFGVFEIKMRAARTAQNPKTLKPVHVPARRTVKFKPGRYLRARLETGRRRDDGETARVEVKAKRGPAPVHH
jgi:nucleoid DNA-binding protein